MGFTGERQHRKAREGGVGEKKTVFRDHSTSWGRAVYLSSYLSFLYFAGRVGTQHHQPLALGQPVLLAQIYPSLCFFLDALFKVFIRSMLFKTKISGRGIERSPPSPSPSLQVNTIVSRMQASN